MNINIYLRSMYMKEVSREYSKLLELIDRYEEALIASPSVSTYNVLKGVIEDLRAIVEHKER